MSAATPVSPAALSTPNKPTLWTPVEVATPGTPVSVDLGTTMNPLDAEGERLRLEQEADAFAHTKSTLLSVIDGCQALLGSLTKYSGDWAIVYPAGAGQSTVGNEVSTLSSAPNGAPLHRSDATKCEEYKLLPRSTSRSDGAPLSTPLTVLSMDPSFGGKARSSSYLSALGSGLNRDALSTMLCSHVATVQTHLGHLRTRMTDGSSRVLVTGDLNAGKSTFVNALLRRDVTPMDQQPCTEVMCEIIDSAVNGNVEEIHAVTAGPLYDIADSHTFSRFPIEDLATLVNVQSEQDDPTETAQSAYEILKVYTTKSTPANICSDQAISLLKEGDISVSFIDAPGLNRDTISTTMLYSKQSTIDVIVFVVSAENQFTLSAQEFLWAASQEKAYVFVVINKWAAISNKARAQRRVLDQVRKLSPRTWDKRDELLHFVDSAAILETMNSPTKGDLVRAFNHLERCLSSFVFRKRLASKLQPAHTFAGNLLCDLLTVSASNLALATQQKNEAVLRLESIRPECERLSSSKAVVDRGILIIEEATVEEVVNQVQQRLTTTLKLVVSGDANVGMPKYQGITRLWQYASDVQRHLASLIELEVTAAEEFARKSTIKAVTTIRTDLGSHVLLDCTQYPERIFRPEVMFARRKRHHWGGPQVVGLGLGLAEVPEVGYADLFNVERFVDFAQAIVKPANDDGALSVIGGVGMGGLALFGTGAASSKAFADSVVRICEVLGSRGARRWAGVLASIAAIGMGVFLVLDLPHAIPRNLGRRLARSVNGSGHWTREEGRRIGKETRKVLRLAGWDLRERCRSALASAEAERKDAMALEVSGTDAQHWFEEFSQEAERLMALVNDAQSTLDLRE